MCGILIYNFDFFINSIDTLLKKRGPDKKTIITIDKIKFVHYLLSMNETQNIQLLNYNNEIICLFDGKIYNYKIFDDKYKSDGECLIPLYQKYGTKYAEYLDGEFAICIFDFKNNIFLLSSDTFRIKPLYYAINNDKFAICSYKSVLLNMNFDNENIKSMSANFTKIFDLITFKLIEQNEIVKFDLKQFKNNFDDWNNAMINSVKKRSLHDNKDIFVSLSSGYDSGLICAILNDLQINYNTIMLDNNKENKKLLKKRASLNQKNKNIIINWNNNSTIFSYQYMLLNTIKNDTKYFPDCIATAYIMDTAKKNNYKINLSGDGADILISDCYGGKLYSNFGGKFPEDLSTIFPKNSEDQDCIWKDFYMKGVFTREESIGGLYSIENRYPFLDKNAVQEFLWLSQELKNKIYKYPIHQLLILLKYPFDKGKKIGLYI